MTRPTIIVRTRRPRVDASSLAAAAEALARRAETLARRRGTTLPEGGVDVLLVCPAASRAAHRAVNGAEGATDVITAPYAATPVCPARAELIVCPAVAIRAAARRDDSTLLPEERGIPWSADLELALYIAHGLDHLAGSDDSTEREYREMRLRELRWIASALPNPPQFFV